MTEKSKVTATKKTIERIEYRAKRAGWIAGRYYEKGALVAMTERAARYEAVETAKAKTAK